MIAKICAGISVNYDVMSVFDHICKTLFKF